MRGEVAPLVAVPYTVVNPEVAAALPAAAEWVYVGGGPDAYWAAMRGLWERCERSGLDLVVVEHDVVLDAGTLPGFDACPQSWCVYGYAGICHPECQEAWANMLGCVRFRSELIRALPDAVSSIPSGLRDWHNLCDSIAGDKVDGMPAPLRPGSVRAAGFSHHWHQPPVAHHPWGPEENKRRLLAAR